MYIYEVSFINIVVYTNIKKKIYIYRERYTRIFGRAPRALDSLIARNTCRSALRS